MLGVGDGYALCGEPVGGGVTQGTDEATSIRGCRVVTTSMTAKLLLANQLNRLQEISWTVVSGDALEGAPGHAVVVVVPIRREFSPSDVPAFVRLWRTFRRERFDFVQTHTPKASFLGLPAARLSGTTAIYTIHGALYFRDNGRMANTVGWLFEKWCCLWADRVLVQSSEDQQALPRARICRAQKIDYVGNGIVLERFLEPVVAERTSPRPIVMMIGRLVREKGCLDFSAVARALAGKADFVHVGPTEPDQHDAVRPSEMESAGVTLVGAVEDVRPYITAADIVVLPSYREGIPRVAMEAAAIGRPVVAYDVRGVREVVGPDSGLLVDRGDVAGLIAAVQLLLGDPNRRAAAGEASRAGAIERFSEDGVITRLRAVYLKVGRR
jgi:glycosyltransferase involved in cell wall biosynthesis